MTVKLFDAVYGDAYTAIERVLAAAPVTAAQLRAILAGVLTPDGAFEVSKKLLDGSWPFLEKRGTLYHSRLKHIPDRPLTLLERSWLRTAAEDPRAALFLSDAQTEALSELDGEVLYDDTMLYSVDAARPGDPFGEEGYRAHFGTILEALREKRGLSLEYVSSRGRTLLVRCRPERLEYSGKDRRFRLRCRVAKGRPMVLNLAGIRSAETIDARWIPVGTDEAEELCEEPIVLKVSKERNALNRFMLEFSYLKKISDMDVNKGVATVQLWYPKRDETEILIRLIGFGSTLKVLGPEPFVKRLKGRIAEQLRLMGTGSAKG